MRAGMGEPTDRTGVDDAFDRIEDTILPCIAMMLDTLSEAASAEGETLDRAAFSAELNTLSLQLEALTREIELINPARVEPGIYRALRAG